MASDKVVRRRTSSFFHRKPNVRPPISQYDHFEDVLEQINPFGRYQLFACLCILFAQIEWSGNLSFVSIVGSAEPDWLCKDARGALLKTIPQPTDRAKCAEIRRDCASVEAVRNSTEFNSIVASFRLICDESARPQLITVIQALSLMIGAILGGHLGDAFGRQFLFYICQLGICITSCLTVASTAWTGFAAAQFCNGILYGIVEVESLTLMMEITNNQFRMIPTACFQTNLANVVVALIAFLTKDWQMFFVFLNLVNLPTIMMFMLWHESPRWLVVLNDFTDKRWNGTEVNFTSKNLERIRRDESNKFYSFKDLFSKPRFAKQSLMQVVSMITCAIVGVCYTRIIREFPGSSILIVLLDGAVRLIIPLLIILLDFEISRFTRRIQFFLALSLMGAFLLVAMVLVMSGVAYNSVSVTVLVTIAAMINDSVFWMNIIQVTTQRYPTVIRCCAFGCVYAAKHLGTILALLIIPPILKSAFPSGAFLLSLLMIITTAVLGVFFQPETKGKALLDTIDDVDYTRVRILVFRLAAIHRVVQQDLKVKIANENRQKWEEWRQHLEERDQQGQGEAGASGQNGVGLRTHQASSTEETD